MTRPETDLFATAETEIRGGDFPKAIGRLRGALPSLPADQARRAHRLIGLAYYFQRKYAEALPAFREAAEGTEVPEDLFNVAMTQLKLGQLDEAEATWQACFDLSYKHQQAPETTTFFEKKALFAGELLEAGRPAPLAIDLLERQLLPFFTNYHVTDPSFWAMRGVPALEIVLKLLRRAYKESGRAESEWAELCHRVADEVDAEGAELCRAWGAYD